MTLKIKKFSCVSYKKRLRVEWFVLLETYWSVIKAHKIFLIMSIWTINSCIAYLFWSNTNPLILFISGWTIEPSFPTQCWRTFWKQCKIVQRFWWLIIMKVRIFQKFRSTSYFLLCYYLFYLTNNKKKFFWNFELTFIAEEIKVS